MTDRDLSWSKFLRMKCAILGVLMCFFIGTGGHLWLFYACLVFYFYVFHTYDVAIKEHEGKVNDRQGT